MSKPIIATYHEVGTNKPKVEPHTHKCLADFCEPEFECDDPNCLLKFKRCSLHAKPKRQITVNAKFTIGKKIQPIPITDDDEVVYFDELTPEQKPLLCICGHPTEHHEVGVMRAVCRVFDCNCVYFREKREADCER